MTPPAVVLDLSFKHASRAPTQPFPAIVLPDLFAPYTNPLAEESSMTTLAPPATRTTSRPKTTPSVSPSRRAARAPSVLGKDARRLLRNIEKHPGQTVTFHTGSLNLGWSTLYASLAELRKAKQVVERRGAKCCFLYPRAKAPHPTKTATVEILNTPTARELALALQKKPGLSLLELAASRSDLAPRLVYYHIRRFVGAGLVTSSSSTRYRDLQATAKLSEALAGPKRRT